MEVIQSDKQFDEPSVLKVLMRLVANNLKEIETNDQISYSEFQNALGLNKEHFEKILEYMRQKNYLIRQCADSILVCPQCRKNEVLSSIQCPKCYFKGVEKNTKVGTISYACKRCGEVFQEPSLKMHCISCDMKLDVTEMVLQDVYSYAINSNTEQQIKGLLKPLQVLKELLAQKGYSTQLFASMKGESGMAHSFDLAASRKIGEREVKVVTNMLMDKDPIGPPHIMRAYAQALDVAADENILIVVPELTEESRMFANFYHIRTFEAKDIDNALEPLAIWLYALMDETSWLR